MHLHLDSAHNAHFVYEPSVCLIGLGFAGGPHGTIRPPPNEKTPRSLIHPQPFPIPWSVHPHVTSSTVFCHLSPILPSMK
jgi:hypothetical protein